MRLLALLAALAVTVSASAQSKSYTADKVVDFAVDGTGTNAAWTNVPWAGGSKWVDYSTGVVIADNMQGDFKVAYSDTAFYLLLKRYAVGATFDAPGPTFSFGKCDLEFFIANPENTATGIANYNHGAFKPAFVGVGVGDTDLSFETGQQGPSTWPNGNANTVSKFQIADAYFQVEAKVSFTAFSASIVDPATKTSFQFQVGSLGDGTVPLTRWNHPANAGGFILRPWGTLNLSGKNANVSEWSQF